MLLITLSAPHAYAPLHPAPHGKDSAVHRNPYESHDEYDAIRTQDADLAVSCEADDMSYDGTNLSLSLSLEILSIVLIWRCNCVVSAHFRNLVVTKVKKVCELLLV